ncbi:signal peptidase II [Oceanibacterium hippocampi]|uniref:Lipoprotein signal peptidase n=1 Tax=Oceanibacterium hippocampi TaxID=745714 RepID=A0A1Y5S5R6_9PROT|nr:signal peptidase II [Oceanibacterium hippocampi]SLN32870.1 Lipoprotein signal peptidase [Oceanibacterium hippocampi]
MLGPALTLASLVAGIDQVVKYLVLRALIGTPSGFTLIPGVDIALVWNRGLVFAFLASPSALARWAFVLLALVLVSALVAWLVWVRRPGLGLALGLIVGGALGNVVDRVIYGAVVDYIDLYSGESHWPAFNLADVAILSGVGFLIIDSLLLRPLGRAGRAQPSG